MDTNPNPYEALGLSRDAKVKEINDAYAKLIRDSRNVARRQEITNAWQCLRRSETRMEQDVWFYGVSASGSVDRPGAMPTESLHLEAVLPNLSFGLEATDLAEGRYRSDFRPLQYGEVQISDLSHYDEPASLALPLSFDR